MKCSCLVIPRLWSTRCTCLRPDHPSQQPILHKSMKKVTVPARCIHNLHPTNRPASQHVTCVRRGGKGTSQRRDTQSSGLALPSTKPSGGSAARANTYMLIISTVQCASPRHVQPANHRSHRPSYQVASNTTNRSVSIAACHTHNVRWWREGERKRNIGMTTSHRPIKPSAGTAGAAGARS